MHQKTTQLTLYLSTTCCFSSKRRRMITRTQKRLKALAWIYFPAEIRLMILEAIARQRSALLSPMGYGNFFYSSVLGDHRITWHWRSMYTLSATANIGSRTYTCPPMMLSIMTQFWIRGGLEVSITTRSMAGFMISKLRVLPKQLYYNSADPSD